MYFRIFLFEQRIGFYALQKSLYFIKGYFFLIEVVNKIWRCKVCRVRRKKVIAFNRIHHLHRKVGALVDVFSAFLLGSDFFCLVYFLHVLILMWLLFSSASARHLLDLLPQ